MAHTWAAVDEGPEELARQLGERRTEAKKSWGREAPTLRVQQMIWPRVQELLHNVRQSDSKKGGAEEQRLEGTAPLEA